MGTKKIACAVCGSRKNELLAVATGNRGLEYIAREHHVVICLDCGLTFLNPQHDVEDYDRYYALSDYKPIKTPPDVFLRRHEYRRIQASYLLDTLRSWWPNRELPDLNAVDIGCGPGVLLHYLAKAGLNVTGLEASDDAADYAEHTLGLNIIRGSVNAELLPENSFDIAVSTASIEHFTDPHGALLAMGQSLKPGGLLYVNTPDLLGMVLKKGEASQFKFVHTYYFTEISLTNLIEKAGYRVIRSWVTPPQLRASIIYPGNYCSGELNIIAVKQGDPAAARPARRTESADTIHKAYAYARKRDRLHAWARDAARFRLIGKLRSLAGRLIKAEPVFSDLIAADGTIREGIFPPLLATNGSPANHGSQTS
jgi:2-polyprenyl-3-methyl-5-hydroxy-6-metoxy-1,4-benzoquinol methylase